jgi:NADH-quinone oxidoreductase subunit J
MFLLATGTEFLALVYLIVYTGAIAVFFLFVIMLINLRREDSGVARPPLSVRLQAILSIHGGIAVVLICFLSGCANYECLITPTIEFIPYTGSINNELSVLGYILYTNFHCAIYGLAALLLMGLVAATVVARIHFSVLHT